MTSNFTIVINYFLKFTNFAFFQLSQIPYINVVIGIFFIFAFLDVAFLILYFIKSRELQPINQGFLNVIGSGGLNSLSDKVPLGYKRFSPVFEDIPLSFSRLGSDRYYPLTSSSLGYEDSSGLNSISSRSLGYDTSGGLNSYGGGLSSVSSGGLNVIGSAGLGSFGGSAGSFGGGLNSFGGRFHRDSHFSSNLSGLSRGGQYAVSSVVRGVDNVSKQNERDRVYQNRVNQFMIDKDYQQQLEIEKEADRVGKLYQQHLIDKERKETFSDNLDYVERLIDNNRISTYRELQKKVNQDTTNRRIAKYLTDNDLS